MGAAAGLVGRAEECEVVAAVISGARNGVGGALVIRGDPGIGKTALLQASTSGLVGVQRLQVDGYEAESSIPFAGVQRLLTPLRAQLPALPARQQQALLIAAGAEEGPPPDRFLVGLGVLGLLGAAGLSRPVVCAVDDAHWLDRESLDVLAFVARRLQAEPAALLLVVREEAGLDRLLSGLASLQLSGLDGDAALQLLRSSSSTPVDPLAAAHMVEATGGNPLALVDLAEELTPRRLAEWGLAEEPLPIGHHLEAHYLRRIRRLDRDVQLWVLVAAADSTGNVGLIQAAATSLELKPGTGDLAEVEGLVELGSAVRFRHPLVRSAAYNASPGPVRRHVHHALSAAAEGLGLTELEAWHAARATVGTDPVVADRLERAADLAGRRGGYASRATVLRRAAQLTPDGAARHRRLILAAESALAAGAAQAAGACLDEVDLDGLAPLLRGRLLAVRAALTFFTADGPGVTRASAGMLAAADCFHGVDAGLEQDALIKAFEYCLAPEHLVRDVSLEELGRRLDAGARLGEGVPAVLLRALAAHVLLPYAEAVPVMRAGVTAITELGPEQLMRYGSASVALTTALWDERARRDCLLRTADAARDAGSLQLVETALWTMSLAELVGGTPRRAQEHMEQVRELRRALGYDAEHVVNVALLAWSGASRARVLQLADEAKAAGFGGIHTAAVVAVAVNDLAGGHYRDAHALLQPLVATPFLQVTPLQWPDAIEAAVRSGHPDEATGPLRQLESRAEASGSSWARGVARRSRALLSADDEAEPWYRDAIEALESADVEVELARAHLLYGEWLRRLKRRREARLQLRAALQGFERTGATRFAARARAELEATGGGPSATDPPGGVDLTPQEATVARLAAAGSTNAEIGAVLFLSANTVDYHLRKVFQKFGITSRRQLAERLAA